MESDDENDIKVLCGYPKLTKAFIKLYEQLPELWNSKHPHYTNKFKRNLAYDKLVEMLRSQIPNVNKFHVRKKINSLRSNYRKELKKHLSSSIESSDGEITYSYTPRAAHFHLMRFLDSAGDEVKLSFEPYEQQNSALDNNQDSDEQNSDYEDEVPKKHKIYPKKKLKRDYETLFIENVKKTKNDYINLSYNDNIDSREYLAIGENVAFKLMRMNTQQRYHAELLINKVLINGLKNNLTEDTDLTDLQVLDTKVFHNTITDPL